MSYFWEVVSLHPKPRHLESFSSYLTRLAEVNGIRHVTKLLSLFWDNLSFRRDLADYPPSTFGSLPISVVCSEETLLGTTFYYLGRKFGRTSDPRILALFLAGSISPHLRYCAKCIEERGFYSLTWRFLSLPGCIVHGCTLLDRCGHCGKTIPCFTAPLQIGICPTCKGNLRTCSPMPLNEKEWQRTEMRSKDLDFLLTHQSWELESDEVLAAVGKKLMALRQEKGMTQVEVADHLRMLKDNITHIEQGPKQLGGKKRQVLTYTSFHRFLAYSEYLNVSCIEGFTQTLDRKEESTDSVNHSVHGLRMQAAKIRTQKILEQVQQAVQELRSLKQAVTFEAIAQRVGLSTKCLSNRAEVKAFLEQTGCKQNSGLKKGEQGEDEVLEHVGQAIKQLEVQGRAATISAIREVVRMPVATLLSYPLVRQLLEEVEATRALTHAIKMKQHEDELVEKVRAGIGMLEAKGQQITQQAIAAIVQQSVESLRACPRVSELLDEQMVKQGYQGWLEQSKTRENELIDKVVPAIKQLIASGEEVTGKAVSQLIGVPCSTLRFYPAIKGLLSQAAQERRLKYIREGSIREEALVTEALKAIEQLESCEQPVNVASIAGILQRSLGVLKTYPRVKALLEQVAETEKAREQKIREQLRETELLRQIEDAVYYLKANGQPVTKVAVGQLIHVLPATFNRFPKIQAFWAQVATRRTQEEKERGELYESTLLKQVEEAIKLLVEQEQSVTHRTIETMVGVSIRTMKKYPKINSLLVSCCTSGHPGKRIKAA